MKAAQKKNRLQKRQESFDTAVKTSNQIAALAAAGGITRPGSLKK